MFVSRLNLCLLACVSSAGAWSCTPVSDISQAVETPDGGDAGLLADASPDSARPAADGGGVKGGGSGIGGGGASGAAGTGAGTGSGGAGAGGMSAMAGEGGDTTDAGTGSMMPAKEPCTSEGAFRCSTRAAGQRDTCSGGFWTMAPACETGEVCRSEPGAMDGSCQMVAEICRGSAGQPVCDGQGVMYQCSADGVIESMSNCMSEKHCQQGLPSKTCLACIPGEFHCTDNKLEQCDEMGKAFATVKECATAALCNTKAGECTDAACVPNKFVCERDVLKKCNADQTALEDVKPCMPGMCDNAAGECDVCTPGRKTCDGDTVVTCNAQGQDYTRVACSGATKQCVGAGQCVACAADADCGDPGACKVRHCNLATGTCEPQNAANGGMCMGGVCKDGACVGCISADDCGDNPGVCKVKGCSANMCMSANAPNGSTCNGSDVCSGGKCVECIKPEDCDDNPGVCQVKGCSASNTCAPVAAPNGSTCNGSDVCSGGKCVECIKPEDCDDDPGQCKVKGCSSNTCAPANAPNGTSCRTGSRNGVCSGGTCVGCTTNSDCARITPDLPICNSGTCVECTSASQCTTSGNCRRATCSGNRCGEEITAWESCGSGRACDAGGICGSACPNGHIDAANNEECEQGVSGWNTLNCEGASCQRLYYRTCSANASCKEASVAGGHCGATGGMCVAGCQTSGDCPLGPPNTTSICYQNQFCALICNGPEDCPAGLTCATDFDDSNGNPNPFKGVCVQNSSCCTTDFGCFGCFWPLGA